MLDTKLEELAHSFASYYEFIEGEDTINGQTFGLIQNLLGVESSEYSDADVLMMIEEVLQNYHQWNKMQAGEL